MNTNTRTVNRGHRSPRDWLGIMSAALLLGFPLALALSGLLLTLTPGGFHAFDAKHQLGMWSIGLFWNLILALSVLFPNGRRAWAGLLLATLLAYGLLFLTKTLLNS